MLTPRVGVMLLLLLALAIVFFATTTRSPRPNSAPQLEFLMNELHADSPFLLQWLHRCIGPSLRRSRMAQPLVRRVVRNDFDNWQRRRNAAARLIANP